MTLSGEIVPIPTDAHGRFCQIFLFIFFFFYFVDMGHFLIFFVFFMLPIFGIPDIERRKRGGLLIDRPQESLSESRWFVVFILF